MFSNPSSQISGKTNVDEVPRFVLKNIYIPHILGSKVNSGVIYNLHISVY